MKKSIRTTIAYSFIVAGLTLTGCNTPAKKVEAAKENVTEAQKDLEKANEEYQVEIENYRKETLQKITDNDKIIADFKVKIEHEKKDIKVEYEKRVDELAKKNIEMKKKLDDYKADGKEKWEKFKAEFSHDMDELGQAFKDLTVKNVK